MYATSSIFIETCSKFKIEEFEGVTFYRISELIGELPAKNSDFILPKQFIHLSSTVKYIFYYEL